MKTSPILVFFIALGACLLASPAAAQTRFTTLYSTTSDGLGKLTSSGGVLYGAFSGPAPTGTDCGGVFELQPPPVIGGAWIETVLYSFAETNDACSPGWGPVIGKDGALYGSTEQGGAYRYGTFYRVQPPASPGGVWTESVLYSFGPFGANFSAPGTNIIAGPDGSFCFLSAGGATGYGALVQMRPPAEAGGAWTGTVVYSFTEGGSGTV